MKKFLGFIALALFVILPLSVNATIKTDFSCSEETKNSEGQTIKVCTIAVTTTNGEAIQAYEGDLTLTNVTLDEASVKGKGAFTNVAVLGNTISFSAAEPQSGERIEIGEFTVIVDTTKTNCSVVLVPTSADVEKDEVKVDVTPVENPKTGSAVSYIAIGAGVLLVAGAYVLSRKNTKMYKI